MDAEALLERLPDAASRIVFRHRQAARSARLDDDPGNESICTKLGVPGLWAHQAAALRALRSGASVIVATGTASGKSLVYQAATIECLAASPATTALWLFPTKALTQDQLGRLQRLGAPEVTAAIYDGDTPAEHRSWIRMHANVVLTNPDMLHAGLLANHERWAGFLRNLALVVVDEAHVYRGVFGAHVALVLRRLRRLAAHRGAAPRFALSSATIGNPAEHAGTLTGLDVVAVTDDGAPSGARIVAGWQPPELDDVPMPARRSVVAESADLLAHLIRHDASTIAFTRSRRAAEVVASAASDQLDGAGRVAAYRAGYLPEERRAIERALLDGDLDGVAATTALELGIDVGGLDAVVVAGMPGTRAALRQQLGRAGRSSKDALGVVVVGDDPLDQYLAQHPDVLFDEPAEDCTADPGNPTVLAQHLACAAFELPLRREDATWFAGGFEDAARAGLLAGELASAGGVVRYAGRGAPHRERGLRSAGPRIQVVDAVSGALLGEASHGQAMRSLHDGAIYLHQGQSFEVERLDLEARVATVRASTAPWYTIARSIGDVDVLGVLDRRPLGGCELAFGPVVVTEHVVSYARRRIGSGELLDERPLDLPEETLRTLGCWITFDDAFLGRARVGPAALPGALHAAEHAAIGLIGLVVACDPMDVGGVSTPLHRSTGAATIVVYDGVEGGAGFSRAGFDRAERWLDATLDRLESCPCPAGCPRCVQSPQCGNGNEPLDKTGAARLVRTLRADAT